MHFLRYEHRDHFDGNQRNYQHSVSLSFVHWGHGSSRIADKNNRLNGCDIETMKYQRGDWKTKAICCELASSQTIFIEEGNTTWFKHQFVRPSVKMKIFTFILSAILLVVAINGAAAASGRCNRLENAKRNLKISGDGGYRIFIDGEPTGYQPGKIYNGKFHRFYYASNMISIRFKFFF